jgi:hypothetical protein
MPGDQRRSPAFKRNRDGDIAAMLVFESRHVALQRAASMRLTKVSHALAQAVATQPPALATSIRAIVPGEKRPGHEPSGEHSDRQMATSSLGRGTSSPRYMPESAMPAGRIMTHDTSAQAGK